MEYSTFMNIGRCLSPLRGECRTMWLRHQLLLYVAVNDAATAVKYSQIIKKLLIPCVGTVCEYFHVVHICYLRNGVHVYCMRMKMV